MKLSPYFLGFFNLFLALSGCSHPDDVDQKDKKQVRLYLQTSPFSLDPRIGVNRISSNVTRHLFEGLFRIDQEGKYRPALAKSVTISEDRCVYTFKLHASKWSNGEEVTAYDFEYAWKSILNPDFPSAFSYLFYNIKNAIEAYKKKCSIDDVGIKSIDSHTLQVTLQHPTPFFLELVANPAFSPLPPSCREKENWAQKAFPEYVSNGPFVLKKHALNSQIILERNPFYWNPSPPETDTISFTIVEDPQTAYNMFCTGDLDWFGEPCGYVPLNMLHGLHSEAFYKKDIGQCTWLQCQIETPLLKSLKVRRAIATAIDRDVICNQLLKCGEKPAYSILPTFLTLLDRPLFKNGNKTEARSLFEKGLKACGYTRKNCPPLTLLHTSDQMLQSIAGLIQKQLEQALGITIILEECDHNALLSRVFSGDFQLALSDWFSLYCDPMYTLNCFKYKEFRMIGSPWENKDYIAFLNKVDAAKTTQERQKYLKKAEEKVVKQLPVIPIIYKNYKYLPPHHLQGYALSDIGQMEFKWAHKTQQKAA